MIRVNLLPVKRARRREAGQRQILFMVMALVGGLGALVFVHLSESNKRDALNRQNRAIQADIDRLKAELGDYDKIKGQREELLRQRKSIQALEAGRTGPVYLLRELSEILTPGKGPTFDRITYEENLRRDPNVGFNATWDTRRVWLESYEEDQKKVKIRAAAKSNDDAAEFLKRLNSSVFFSEVALENTTATQSVQGGAVKYTNFSLTTTVTY